MKLIFSAILISLLSACSSAPMRLPASLCHSGENCAFVTHIFDIAKEEPQERGSVRVFTATSGHHLTLVCQSRVENLLPPDQHGQLTWFITAPPHEYADAGTAGFHDLNDCRDDINQISFILSHGGPVRVGVDRDGLHVLSADQLLMSKTMLNRLELQDDKFGNH